MFFYKTKPLPDFKVASFCLKSLQTGDSTLMRTAGTFSIAFLSFDFFSFETPDDSS